MRLEGKVALITGSTAGLGRAGALLFAREGARVVVVGTNDKRGDEVVGWIKGAGGEASYVRADVGIVAEVERMIKAAVNIYGRLDIFWHNAGIAGPGSILRTSEEAFDRTFSIHTKGAFFGAKFAIPEMKKSGGGSILFTTAPAAYKVFYVVSPPANKPQVGSPTYSLAKAGLSMLARCLAVEFARDNIRVNCICPGPVRTELATDSTRRDPDRIDPQVFEKRVMENTPMGRFGEAEDIARGALYLVSEDARFVTGAVLAVDGGLIAT